jgi:hypothetical protein
MAGVDGVIAAREWYELKDRLDRVLRGYPA